MTYGSHHSSDQHPKDVNSKNPNDCPIFVREFFVLPKADSRGVEFLCSYRVWIFGPLPEKLPSLLRTEIRFFFFFFFVFCGHKLLRVCLKAPALTGYVGDALAMTSNAMGISCETVHTTKPGFKMVSEYCCAGLSTKQAMEPYLDQEPPQPYQEPSKRYSDKEIPFRRALRRLPCKLASQVAIQRKSALSQLGNVHETVLRHLRALLARPPLQIVRRRFGSFFGSFYALLGPLFVLIKKSPGNSNCRFVL